jgi:hypothetical protein
MRLPEYYYIIEVDVDIARYCTEVPEFLGETRTCFLQVPNQAPIMSINPPINPQGRENVPLQWPLERCHPMSRTG